MLRITLEDGFEGDEVGVFVDGQEVYRKRNLSTRTAISLADSMELDVQDGLHKVALRLENRPLSAETDVEIRDETTLLVSIIHGQISFQVVSGPYGYA